MGGVDLVDEVSSFNPITGNYGTCTGTLLVIGRYGSVDNSVSRDSRTGGWFLSHLGRGETSNGSCLNCRATIPVSTASFMAFIVATYSINLISFNGPSSKQGIKRDSYLTFASLTVTDPIITSGRVNSVTIKLSGLI